MSRLAAFVMALACVSPAYGASFDLELLPTRSISALPGETVGWGYRIHNTSSDWLEFVTVFSDGFIDGTPSVLFDFPVLAPNATRELAWSPGLAGLAEFMWDGGVARGTVNAGLFTLTASVWDNDPLNSPGATLLGTATQSVAYEVVAGAAVIPEPATLILLGSGLVGVGLRRRGHRDARR